MSDTGWNRGASEEPRFQGSFASGFGEAFSDDEEGEEEFAEEQFSEDEFSDDEEEEDEFAAFEDEGEAEEDDEDGDFDALVEEGESLAENGDYDEALEHFRDLAERYPEEPLPFYHIGRTALLRLTEGLEGLEGGNWQDDEELASAYEEALNAFDSALSLDEEYVQALNGQGMLYLVTDNMDAAIECWERSLEIDADQEDIEEALEEARGQQTQ